MNPSLLLARFHSAADRFQAPLLLVIRLYWGVQFLQTGFGKVTHLGSTAAYFNELGLRLPHLSAALAGGTELGGGLLLTVGLFTRLAALPLLVTMLTAYATAERAALAGLLRDPEAFTSAAPFLFLLASLILLAFGPGAFSLDRLLRRDHPAPQSPH